MRLGMFSSCYYFMRNLSLNVLINRKVCISNIFFPNSINSARQSDRFVGLWSISWYQWRRDVMTPGRHQFTPMTSGWHRCEFTSMTSGWHLGQTWLLLLLMLLLQRLQQQQQQQWQWPNLAQMSTRRHWCEFTFHIDVNPTSSVWIDDVPESWRPGVIDTTRLIK